MTAPTTKELRECPECVKTSVGIQVCPRHSALIDEELERTVVTTGPDMVHHPPHYTGHPSGVECITIVEHMDFCIGNAIKYLWRAGLKEGTDAVEDLRKAEWYVHREIERLSHGS